EDVPFAEGVLFQVFFDLGLDTTGLDRVAGDDDVGGLGGGVAVQAFRWRSMHGKGSPDIRPPRRSRGSKPPTRPRARKTRTVRLIRLCATRTQDRGRLPQSLPRSPASGKTPCRPARSKKGPLGPVPGSRFLLLHGAGSAPGNRKVTSTSPDPRWQAARSERLKGCLLFLVNLEELVELGDLEDLKNLRGDIA